MPKISTHKRLPPRRRAQQPSYGVERRRTLRWWAKLGITADDAQQDNDVWNAHHASASASNSSDSTHASSWSAVTENNGWGPGGWGEDDVDADPWSGGGWGSVATEVPTDWSQGGAWGPGGWSDVHVVASDVVDST
ncbi:hypothetical protein C8R43DRAFT_1117892 [Mycena crocata]|nr:hypothetical protein C8R43DRAFT_1117892 [Mycena crocata]